MISKLALCHELALSDLEKSINFIKDQVQVDELLCLHLDEMKEYDLSDFWIYIFHLNLNDELKVHAELSRWALKNNLKLANPFFEESNIFDDKYGFAQFLLANQMPHPETLFYKQGDYSDGYVVKARHGTEKRDFAAFSSQAVEKIASYDDVLVQEKVSVKTEVKILKFGDKFFSDQDIDTRLYSEILGFDTKLTKFFEQKDLLETKIYSLDILLDQDDKFYFLEANLRPGAFYRFTNLLRC